MTDGLTDVHSEAFAAPPHREPPEADLVGCGYGHTSRPGQWWHDGAADALAPEEAARWLDEPFVVVDPAAPSPAAIRT
jgi:hypothetical protein